MSAPSIERYREAGRERFLTNEELSRLGDALREAETVGLAWNVDESKPGAKHLPRESNRRRVLDPFAVAAIRLLILTGARLREMLDAALIASEGSASVRNLTTLMQLRAIDGSEAQFIERSDRDALATTPERPVILFGDTVGGIGQ